LKIFQENLTKSVDFVVTVGYTYIIPLVKTNGIYNFTKGSGAMQISLAAARVNSKLSQDEVAKALGVSRTTVTNWENDKCVPSHKHFQDLCRLYNVPGDFIFMPNV